jgi:hypothetical protein
VWINHSGDVVHPDAPAGGGGPGFFRIAGPLCAGLVVLTRLLHHRAPAARTQDPLELLKEEIMRDKFVY